MDTTKVHTEDSEVELLERFLQSRNERVFRELYRRNNPAVYRTVLRVLGSGEQAAAEIVQQAWVAALQGLDNFRRESKFSTWIIGIAIRLCYARFRRDKKHAGDNAETQETLAAPVTDPIGRIDMENSIRALPEGYRAVLLLHDVEGYTHREIAQILEISEGTAKSQLFHARSKMRAYLSDPENKGK